MKTQRPFADRRAAGRALAQVLAKKNLVAPVVLALPRGGVPVAAEIASALGAPLDIVLVRKIGVPFQPELAAAAVVDGGDPEVVTNDDVIRLAGVTPADLAAGPNVSSKRSTAGGASICRDERVCRSRVGPLFSWTTELQPGQACVPR